MAVEMGRQVRESLAACFDAASLQKSRLELARRLYIDGTWAVEIQPRSQASLFPMLVDVAGFASQALRGSLWDSQERREIEARLWSALDAEPLVAGVAHSAESTVKEILASDSGQALEVLRGVCLDGSRPNFAASLMRCLGRQEERPGSRAWRLALVRDCLREGDAEVRETAVQLAEVWEEAGVCSILKAHREPESWLREYIGDVIEDADE